MLVEAQCALYQDNESFHQEVKKSCLLKERGTLNSDGLDSSNEEVSDELGSFQEFALAA